jgi:hypothetical protein
MDINEINKLQDIALSDSQVMNLINHDANLILYKDIHKYNNIDELLGQHGAAVILYESKPAYGHWTTIFKVSPNEIEFFNSYGNQNNHDGIPDAMLKFIPKSFRKQSNQDHTYLSKLMYDSKYDLSYNQYNYQGDGENIKTCGRHIATRLNNRNLSLNKYNEYIKKMCRELNLNSDQLVSYLTRQAN